MKKPAAIPVGFSDIFAAVGSSGRMALLASWSFVAAFVGSHESASTSLRAALHLLTGSALRPPHTKRNGHCSRLIPPARKVAESAFDINMLDSAPLSPFVTAL
ncbi:MAG: hypothetical protein AAF543_09860 [Pseudomonadota bacterium]